MVSTTFNYFYFIVKYINTYNFSLQNYTENNICGNTMEFATFK